jgi:hypothetical protein
MSAWNDFVKKIYWENHKKNANYSFKDALKEASKRKGEMGKSTSTAMGKSSSKAMGKSKKANKSRAKKGGKRRGTRKNRKH